MVNSWFFTFVANVPLVKMDTPDVHCLFFMEIKKKEEDCQSTPHIRNLSGCAIYWDNLTCWKPTAVGTTVNLTCPKYVPYFKNHSGSVWRNCTKDGWSDEFPKYKDACDYKAIDVDAEEGLLLTLKNVYTVGYSASLIALLLAMAILLAFRKLHCTRNRIHVNYFFSFILRAISVFIKDIFVLNKECETSRVWCRSFMVFLHYCVMANFTWMLVEAIYLQILLSFPFTAKECFLCYVLLGWGLPAFFVTIWLLYRLKYDNNGCWIHSFKINFSWCIINGPIFVSIMINVVIFLYIIKVLIMKLQLPIGGNYTSRRFRRFAKATLLLIPLLGIDFSIFAFVNTRFRIMLGLCTASLQGFVVAILYCFLNAEVQAELKAAWRSWISNRQLQGQPMQPQQRPSILSEDHVVTHSTI
uniref:vasoactive intestinal polypeptide receptor 2-like isoform X2 n=1 Tax=Myxine glutinosa TaxID=7769 RepID=UPI00358FDE1C